MSELPERFGNFVLLKHLGRGVTGDVSLARPVSPNLGLPAALVVKRMHPEMVSSSELVRRFEHEARVATLIDSPHVVKVFDAGRIGQRLYAALEYVAGWPLSRFLQDLKASNRPPGLSAVVEMVSHALLGLTAIHEAKTATGDPLALVHRDLSPKNIMVGDDGIVRLIDLGLGKSKLQDWRTATGLVMGSLGYMPPEQAKGEAVDQRADVYALGCVLFELLTLEPYIKRGTIPEMLARCMMPSFRAPSSVRPDVPGTLDEVVRTAVAADPKNRFASAAELLAAIKSAFPQPITEGGVQPLFGDVLRAELDEDRTQVTRLISITIAEDRSPKAEEPVTIFARRAAVGLPEDARALELHIRNTRQIAPEVQTALERLEEVSVPRVTSASASASASASVSAEPMLKRPVRRRFFPTTILVALLPLMLVLGVELERRRAPAPVGKELRNRSVLPPTKAAKIGAIGAPRRAEGAAVEGAESVQIGPHEEPARGGGSARAPRSKLRRSSGPDAAPRTRPTSERSLSTKSSLKPDAVSGEPPPSEVSPVAPRAQEPPPTEEDPARIQGMIARARAVWKRTESVDAPASRRARALLHELTQVAPTDAAALERFENELAVLENVERK